jgi:hypothetical protein
MAITDRHIFGWEKELELKEMLEAFLEEELTKTASRWNAIDFVSPSYAAELKCRRAVDEKGRSVDSTTNDTWLLPACKVSSSIGKKQIYFYYWHGDKTLWYLWKDDADWNTIFRTVPHFSTQLHYYVPKDLWTQLEFVDE